MDRYIVSAGSWFDFEKKSFMIRRLGGLAPKPPANFADALQNTRAVVYKRT